MYGIIENYLKSFALINLKIILLNFFIKFSKFMHFF